VWSTAISIYLYSVLTIYLRAILLIFPPHIPSLPITHSSRRFPSKTLYEGEWWGGGIGSVILELGNRWRCMVTFTTWRLILGERSPPPATHETGIFVGPTAGLDTLENTVICRKWLYGSDVLNFSVFSTLFSPQTLCFQIIE
jgi:hypothetical protein